MNLFPRARRGVLLTLITWLLLFAGVMLLSRSVAYAPPSVNHVVQTRTMIGPPLPQKSAPVLASRGEDLDEWWTVTAYTAGEESTGKSPGDPAYGVTASGTQVKEGDCACDSSIPFGTRFDVFGVGVVVCSDRGGAIVGRHLDIYMSDLDDALAFGKKTVRVRRL